MRACVSVWVSCVCACVCVCEGVCVHVCACVCEGVRVSVCACVYMYIVRTSRGDSVVWQWRNVCQPIDGQQGGPGHVHQHTAWRKRSRQENAARFHLS